MTDFMPTNTLFSEAAGFNALDQRRVRREAGTQLAGGNADLAAATLYEAGDLDGGRSITADVDRRAATALSAEAAERAEKLKWIGQGSQSLMQLPLDARQETWLSTLRPTMAAMGYDEATLAQLDASPKTDENLRALMAAAGQEVESIYANDLKSGDNVIRPTAQGAYETVYTAPVDPNEGVPTGYRRAPDGNLTFIPGGPADPAFRGTQAAATRAPPRGRASGGGSRSRSGGSAPARSSSLPPGFRID